MILGLVLVLILVLVESLQQALQSGAVDPVLVAESYGWEQQLEISKTSIKQSHYKSMNV